jgi:pantoate--beta-alanine ligase
MIIFKLSDQLSAYCEKQKSAGLKIGFVPTMGALHQGHLSLIEASRAQNDITICSIFINPTQFNNKEDFRNYPVTLEQDIERLIAGGCDVLFQPSAKEIYPPAFVPKMYDLGQLEHILEGFYRPGHFQGVCQVVERLLTIIHPHVLYLGQKDFQQCMVIKRLLELMKDTPPIRLEIIPTVREKDGLAMSSRNLRLMEDQREIAPVIYHTLSEIRQNIHTKPLGQLEQEAKENLQKYTFVVDYVSIVNANTLAPAQSISEPLVAVVAAFLGDIRLIDNFILN